MALQILENLGMLGIGLLELDAFQPMQLNPGIHLTWRVKRDLGFPWCGFCLFRRKHIPGDYLCISKATAGQPAGTPLGTAIDTNYGRIESDKSLIKRASPPLPLGFDLANRSYLRFSLYPGQLARKVKVSIQFPGSEIITTLANTSQEIPIAFMHQDTLLFETSAKVTPGGKSSTSSIEVEFDAIDAVQIGAGQAALIDICFVPVSQNAEVGWELVPDFGNKLLGLPVSDKSYPPNSGDENLSSARALAWSRVKYGDPTRVIPPELSIATSGSIRISKDFPIVSGVGTNWNDDIVGGVIQASGDKNVRTIVAVIAPDKLVLSRNYQGAFGAKGSYKINIDPFGQMHDLLEVLVHGGSASGPMVNRSIPAIIDNLQRIRLVQGSPVVTGLFTNWTKELEGLALQVIRISGGRAAVRTGDPIVEITGNTLSSDLVGLTFKLADDDTGYTIAGVISQKLLMLDSPYTGDTGIGKAYTIVEGPVYTISKVNFLTQMILDRSYSGVTAKSGVVRNYTITAISQPEDTQTPMISSQHPLDLILFASLDPAIAQILGLYWIDEAAELNTSYDYMIVAYYNAKGSTSPSPGAVLGEIRSLGFNDNFDAFITFNKGLVDTPLPPTPKDPRIYLLPGGGTHIVHVTPLPTPTLPPKSQGSSAPVGVAGDIEVVENSANNVGLHWDIDEVEQRPQQPVMYHIWRADLGPTEPQNPPPDSSYQLITKDAPIVVAEPELAPLSSPERPRDWPHFPMKAFDRDLFDGWYSYRISSVDIFGRESEMSAPAVWHQWSPAPEPRPYYYQDPPEDKAIHSFAVHTRDTIPPPMPKGIEAYALSPDDPFVLRDAAYEAWRSTLNPGDRDKVTGLRVRWQWTDEQSNLAPDTLEFRIYYQPGRLNAVLGHTLNVSPVRGNNSRVETDIPNSLPAKSNAYASTWLRIGQDAFEVMASDLTSPVVLSRVRNIGPNDEIRPQASAPCTIIIPPIYDAGTVSTIQGSDVVSGTRTDWTPNLVDRNFRIRGDIEEYAIARVDSPEQLILDRSYSGISGNGRDYNISHPLFTDYSAAKNWSERIFVVGYDEYATITTDEDGMPLREYEVFLPMPHTVEGDSFGPTEESPIVYAQIGVSAADGALLTKDDPKWPVPGWGGRDGNESRIAAPAQIFRVRREKPARPEPPVEPEMANASPADYYGRSFYTYRWRPAAGMKVHVFRALDDALFNFDWQRISGPGSSPASRLPIVDPNETDQNRSPFPSDWTPARRKAAADAVNAIASLDDYQKLSNDALRVLASLPENERAFTQVTVSPLDPDDPANANRRGPDNKEGFVVDSGLRAYVDAQEGRSVNRYFYRMAYVNEAQNNSTLSISGPPVLLQDMTPPISPKIISVVGGDKEIIIHWTSPKLSLHRFLIYRILDREKASDIRLLGNPVANLPATILVTEGGKVDLGIGTDVTLVEKVYKADELEPDEDPLTGASATQYLASPATPVGTVISGLTVPDGTEIVAVFRDSQNTLQHTLLRNYIGRWTEQPVASNIPIYYGMIATKETDFNGQTLEIKSPLSQVVVGKAFDVSPPEPVQWQNAQWVKVDGLGNEHPWTDTVSPFTPAVKLVWMAETYEVIIQKKAAGAMVWESVTPWLTGTNEYRDDQVEAGPDYEYRIKARKGNGLTSLSSILPVQGVQL